MAEETMADVELNKSQDDDADKSEDELNNAKMGGKGAKAKLTKKRESKASTEEDEEDESSDDEEQLGIFDKPIVIEGKRQRKSTEFLHTTQQSEKKEPKMLEFIGKGEKLGNMERAVHELSHSTPLELKPLHKLLFGREGRQHEIKKNIKNFNGFSFEKGSKEYDDKVSRVERFTNQGLQRLCEIFDIEKKGKRDEIMSRVMEFLMLPKPSGKPLSVPKKKKSKSKPKKKKAKQSREESKGKKRKAEPKSKEEVEDGSDEEEGDGKEQTSEEEVDEPPKKKKKVEKPKPKASPEKSSSPKKKAVKAKETKESPKKKTTKKEKDKDKKASKKTSKKGGPVAVKITPLKKASPKKTPKKEKPKPVKEDESSSDEEPLAKKTKKPPSDADLEKVVREILDGADLEQVTMKSVCKQVFEKYPDFDLISRKDFIKETVRKVIS